MEKRDFNPVEDSYSSLPANVIGLSIYCTIDMDFDRLIVFEYLPLNLFQATLQSEISSFEADEREFLYGLEAAISAGFFDTDDQLVIDAVEEYFDL
ncbi:hypothetical protein EQV77_00980 [Halobacillus fulvus]|nr:hypothetical protein EQV77_00980 [Halobacillus fulvus]